MNSTTRSRTTCLSPEPPYRSIRRLCSVYLCWPIPVPGIRRSFCPHDFPRLGLKYQPCFHCKKPECVPACPEDALYIRELDGIVLLREELCDGCMECLHACPWHVPVYHSQTGKMIKCDFCVDRIDAGLEPACVTGCTTHALKFVLTREKNVEKAA